MRGLDGNYMNMQGDASTRIQVAYLAEQNVQQARAQAEAIDSLRKLREEVKESQAGSGSSQLSEVKDYRDEQAGGGSFEKPKNRGQRSFAVKEENDFEKRQHPVSHIDLKV
jgi:hypothetical protein